MRKAVPALLFVLTVLCLWGCKKDEPLQPYYPSDYGDLQYSINGIVDTSMEQTSTVTFQLSVERIAGKFEPVTLNIKELPKGMTAEFNPASSTPPYISFLTLEADQVDEGVYTLQIVSSSQTTGLKYTDLKVTVLPYSNPALALKGSFREQRACTQIGDSSHEVSITPVAGVVGKVDIRGIWVGNNSYTVTATVNQTQQLIVIPEQSVNNLVFKGNGTYTKNTIDLTYSVKDTALSHIVDDNCTSKFSKL